MLNKTKFNSIQVFYDVKDLIQQPETQLSIDEHLEVYYSHF